MIPTKTLSAMIASAALGACTVAPLMPAPRARPIVVPVEAQCTFTPTYRADQNCCVLKPYTVGLDVDEAYRRVMREYQFGEQLRPWEGEAEAYPEINKGHQYLTRPGSEYQLKGIVIPNSEPLLFRGLWVGLVISKAGPNRSDVSPIYCEAFGRAMQDQVAWHRAAQASIRATLPAERAREQ
jgi:hypothetical protein